MAKREDDLVFAVGNMADGQKVLALGLTANGIDALAAGRSIAFQLPPGLRDFSGGVLFAGETLNDVREWFLKTGLPVEGFPS